MEGMVHKGMVHGGQNQGCGSSEEIEAENEPVAHRGVGEVVADHGLEKDLREDR